MCCFHPVPKGFPQTRTVWNRSDPTDAEALPPELPEGQENHIRSLRDCLRQMDEAGIERFAAHSVALTPHNVERINTFIMEAYAQVPDRIVPFA